MISTFMLGASYLRFGAWLAEWFGTGFRHVAWEKLAHLQCCFAPAAPQPKAQIS